MRHIRKASVLNCCLFFSLFAPLSINQKIDASYGSSIGYKGSDTETSESPIDNVSDNSQEEQSVNSVSFNPIPVSRYYEFPQQPVVEQTINYFKNLKENLPLNNVGNCGYVAISALLGYYDSYFSDYFIPEEYDKVVTNSSLNDSTYLSSPCVVDFPVENYTSFNSYVDRMISNGSFVGYLYSLSREKGYLSNTQTDGAMYYKHLGKLLNYYISKQPDELKSLAPVPSTSPTISIIKPSPISVIQRECVNELKSGEERLPNEKLVTKQELRSELIARLQVRKPAIVAGNNHFCIAYYYDAEKDIIYGNRGWENADVSRNNFVNLDNFFSQKPMLYWYGLELNNFGHSHTNNFIETKKELLFTAADVNWIPINATK